MTYVMHATYRYVCVKYVIYESYVSYMHHMYHMHHICIIYQPCVIYAISATNIACILIYILIYIYIYEIYASYMRCMCHTPHICDKYVMYASYRLFVRPIYHYISCTQWVMCHVSCMRHIYQVETIDAPCTGCTQHRCHVQMSCTDVMHQFTHVRQV